MCIHQRNETDAIECVCDALPQVPAPPTATPRASSGGAASRQPSRRRRPGHVDLGRLQEGTLRKYGTHFNLAEASYDGPKEELLPAVAKHFSSQVISDEQDTVFQFFLALRKRKLLDDGPSSGTPPSRKQQRAAARRSSK